MGKYNGAIITTAGQQMFADAVVGGQTVSFMTMQASSHVYPSSTNFEALTSLDDIESEIAINYAGVYSGNVVQISGRFDNTDVSEPYFIQTIGIFAKLGSGSAQLIAVSTAVTPDQMPTYDAENPSAFIYNFQVVVQNASSISVSVNPAGTITADQLRIVREELEAMINGKAPTNHASTATTYGAGNGTNYGHVKLTDTYATVSTSQKAANSVGASAWALQTVNGFIGKLTDLTTTVKTSVVAAINELKSGKLDADANAVSATKLKDARSLTVDLNSIEAASFDGTANKDIGVKNSLPIAHGGTGATTASGARTNLGVPPTSHAASSTTYGGATASNYGHTKLSDTYDTVSTSQKAANSIGASAWALQTVNGFIGKLSDLTTTATGSIVAAINELKSGKLDTTANAASATKLQTARNLIVDLASTAAASFNGTANKDVGVKNQLPIANGGTGATTAADARTNLSVPPKSHASTGTGYGVGTTANYGHNKIIDGLTKTSLANGEALSAHMGNILAGFLAPVQQNLTALYTYNVGMNFIYNNKLYIATSIINQGGNIVIGTNCIESNQLAYKLYLKGHGVLLAQLTLTDRIKSFSQPYANFSQLKLILTMLQSNVYYDLAEITMPIENFTGNQVALTWNNGTILRWADVLIDLTAQTGTIVQGDNIQSVDIYGIY